LSPAAGRESHDSCPCARAGSSLSIHHVHPERPDSSRCAPRPPRPPFCPCAVRLRRAPSTAVAPTPLDAPSAAGGHLGLFGYLLFEFSTLMPSIDDLRFVFAFVFTERVCVVARTGVDVTCRGARRALFCVDSDVYLVKLLVYQARTGLIRTIGCREQATRPRQALRVHAVWKGTHH